MKSVIAVSSLIAAASALTAPTGPFTSGAWNPSTLWFGSAIQANGGAFFIGKDPSSYCPEVDGLDCTLFPGSSTVFIGGNNTLSLDVAVPGGQQVFVTPEGAIGYTPAHSTFKPTGSVLDGWDRFQSEAGGAPVPMNFQSNSFLACPVNATESGVYQVFARSLRTDGTDCTLFQWRTYTASGVDAWQY
ncbi:hypothetical protein B0J14DRAFT_609528 [Halenospora varia]|nr:hypothetical protein B0J14DRAFT_609528 [Halenospora varia]